MRSSPACNSPIATPDPPVELSTPRRTSHPSEGVPTPGSLEDPPPHPQEGQQNTSKRALRNLLDCILVAGARTAVPVEVGVYVNAIGEINEMDMVNQHYCRNFSFEKYILRKERKIIYVWKGKKRFMIE